MDLTSTAMDIAGMGLRPASEPFVFAGTIGLYEPARGNSRSIAVLFANPWGLEDMCTRKFRRVIAEKLADEGIASLRFDYPHTGDALDEENGATGFQGWVSVFSAAAVQLKHLSGCQTIIVVAQGIGALVAASACCHRQDIQAAAFLAPVVSGRAYVRELSIMSRMVNEKLDIALPEASPDSLLIGGLHVPADVVSDLKKINLTKLDGLSLRHLIVFTRKGNAGDQDLVSHFAGSSCAVTTADFTSYETMTTDPTLAVVPEDVVTRLLSWVLDLAPPIIQTSQRETCPHDALLGRHFEEKPVRFGEGKRLLGILCKSSSTIPRRNVTVLMISAGYEPMWGWARMSVRLARTLAEHGISSLRFDCANVADSPPVPDSARQVLYSQNQVADVAAAVSFLKETYPQAAIIATGRCSGAYLGFRAILANEDITGAVIVNPLVYEWPEGKSVDEALRTPLLRSADHYYARLGQKGAWKKVLRGEVDVLAKVQQVIKAGLRAAAAPVAHYVGGLNRRERSILSGFRALARRSAPLTLIYSANDVGLAEFNHFFKKDGSRLKSRPNISLTIVANADHNFTPPHAFDSYVSELKKMADKVL